MTAIKRAFYCIYTESVEPTAAFYVEHFGFRQEFTSDWFIHLQAPHDANIELGIMRIDHDIVPPRFRGPPRSGMLTLVVDDVDAVHARFQREERPIHEAPRDLFYGQRRMLTEDPAGTLLDVSSECAPSPEFIASLS